MSQPATHRPRPRRRRLVLVAGLLVALYLAACLWIRTSQVELVFRPVAVIPTNPARMGMDYEEITIPFDGGEGPASIDGFWVPAAAPDAPAFLYLHGNKVTIGHHLDHTRRLHEMGYHVLLVDYRGFGDSHDDTRPSETKANKDAEVAWNYLLAERGIDPGRAFIYGHSLGGAIAIELACQHPEAAGLVTESTFTSVLEMSKLQYHGALRLLPMDLLLHQRFESLERIRALKVPVLLIHGKIDEKIPFSMSEQLHTAAPEPKQLLLIEGGEHANSGSVGRVEYRAAVAEFVRQHLRAAPRSPDPQTPATSPSPSPPRRPAPGP